MWNFRIGRSFGLMLQTLPFIALRTAVYFGCSLLLILGWIGGPALGAYVAPASMWETGAWVGFAIGSVASGTVVYFVREYFLYLVKAGHIAVLVELMEGRSLPKGKGQLRYAKEIVAERFVEASAFFVLDQVISGILAVVNRVLVGLGSFIPGLDGAMAFVGRVLRVSLTFADEVILALSFRTKSNDVWRTSRDGVVLYAQNYKNILKNAFFLAMLNYALIFVFFLVAWAPASWIAGLMPGTGSAILSFIVTVLLVYSIKKALIEPLLMTALMQVYFRAIEGQVPTPAWTEKLDGLSEKFRAMQEKFVGPASSAPLIPSAVETQPTSAGQWQQTHPESSHPQSGYPHPASSHPQSGYPHPASSHPQSGYRTGSQAQSAYPQSVAPQPSYDQQPSYADQQSAYAQSAAPHNYQYSSQFAAPHSSHQAQQSMHAQPAHQPEAGAHQAASSPSHFAQPLHLQAKAPAIGSTTLPMGLVKTDL